MVSAVSVVSNSTLRCREVGPSSVAVTMILDGRQQNHFGSFSCFQHGEGEGEVEGVEGLEFCTASIVSDNSSHWSIDKTLKQL